LWKERGKAGHLGVCQPEKITHIIAPVWEQ
ncbi:MAG: hypothetical protein ACI92Z_000613, partial [Paracoccaceae bacterium]